MKTLRTLLTSVLIIFSASVMGQPWLKIIHLEFPSYLRIDTTHQFNCYVKNVGDSDFKDTIEILFKTDFNPTTEVLYRADSINHIHPKDSARVFGHFRANQSEFRKGNNIIVIWPANAARTVPGDSVTIPIVAIGISEKHDPLPLIIYPNPAKTHLSINYNGLQSQIDYVRIMNRVGQQVYSSAITDAEINLESFKSGEYFIVFSFKNKPPYLYRFVKE